MLPLSPFLHDHPMRSLRGGRASAELAARFCPWSSSTSMGDCNDCIICMFALSLSNCSWKGTIAAAIVAAMVSCKLRMFTFGGCEPAAGDAVSVLGVLEAAFGNGAADGPHAFGTP